MELQQKEWEYGGFWRRFLAYLMDLFIIFVPIGLLYIIFCTLFVVKTRENGSGPSAIFAVITTGDIHVLMKVLQLWGIAGFIISIIYFSVLHSSRLQATFGKWVFGLKVVDENYERLTFRRALGRYFAAILSTILYIGYIIAVFTKRKQALHDMIASTFVIKREPVTALRMEEDTEKGF